MNYGWDCQLIDIPKDVFCKCGTKLCKKRLMLAKGIDRTKAQRKEFHKGHWDLLI